METRCPSEEDIGYSYDVVEGLKKSGFKVKQQKSEGVLLVDPGFCVNLK